MSNSVVHSTGNLKKNGVYPAGQLYVKRSSDDDGGTMLKFVSKNDSTILLWGISGDFIDAYYVYDRFGGLCYVLSRLAVDHYDAQGNGVIS